MVNSRRSTSMTNSSQVQLNLIKTKSQQNRNIYFSLDSMSSIQSVDSAETSERNSTTERNRQKDISTQFSSICQRHTLYTLGGNSYNNTLGGNSYNNIDHTTTEGDFIMESATSTASPDDASSTISQTSMPYESSQISSSSSSSSTLPPPSPSTPSSPLSSTPSSIIPLFLGSFIKYSNKIISLRNSDASSINGKSSSFSAFRACSLLYTIFVVLTLLAMHVPSVNATGMCRGVVCANGGRLRARNTVYGHCRCNCPNGFVGPYCQYELVRKRSTEYTTNVGRNSRLQHIRQQLLRLAYDRRRRNRTLAGLANTAGIPPPDTVEIRPTEAYRITGLIRPRRSFNSWPTLVKRLLS